MRSIADILNTIQARNPVSPILETLWTEGFQAFLAGGVVRDAFLGISPEDVDILTNALPEDLARLFADQNPKYVGKSFAVTLVNKVEVATCRPADKKAVDAGHTFPATDLGRRDLTINSMAWDPETRTLADPFGGQADIEHKTIRFTRDPFDRIEEDPVRMVRACRFAARFGFKIEPDAFNAIRTRAHKIMTQGTADRIQREVVKAMGMDKPSRFFLLLHDTGLLARILPSLDRCYDLDGGPNHGETVFEHNLLVGDALPACMPILRLAGFLHDTGKMDAREIKEGRNTFPGHQKCTRAMMADLERLRFSRKDMDHIHALVRGHMRPLKADTSPKAVRRLLAMLDDLNLTYQDFLRMRIADKKGNLNPVKKPYSLGDIRLRLGKILNAINEKTPFNMNDLAISGRDIQDILGLPQGPAIGKVKAFLFEQVLEDPSLNQKKTLENLVRQMSQKHFTDSDGKAIK
ncbi:CCA tRNA nucleotidyltransferase [Desulfobacter hydrogenophilus]|uniref:CCA tRNA nucleotidyltransferase n=1 Tax=Desulfobacter hydrogenophilus TaxID=2291 RepID=A0A328FIU1_9BACT|nr:CCA tRNA nucleotidyltransferase [Desulfobacter hydrogenophilus]NDY70754.1 CCA tRNA nucleotidyltransferase [Desulfobacter hydrogenophilus]QBH12635.1 CCA tRNA nucleotidyltransferase [Desulfobacter hydrogenophilus]RAM03402.1 CCA tRNA nucleotidyltransferase [Desulfobacter hydrogenophilus]